MFTTLAFTAALAMMNTGNEQTAQSLKFDLVELHIGNGCYMAADEAAKLLQPGQYQAGKNPLYVHLTNDGLKSLLRRGKFVISTKED